MGRAEANAVLRDFFSSTTCHGLQQIDVATKVRAAMWIAAVLVTTTFCAYQFGSLYLEVERHEVTVLPELSDEPIPFPAVTMCNLNPYVASRLERVPQLKALEKVARAVTGKGSQAARSKRAVNTSTAASLSHRRPKRNTMSYDWCRSVIGANPNTVKMVEKTCYAADSTAEMDYATAKSACGTGRLARPFTVDVLNALADIRTGYPNDFWVGLEQIPGSAEPHGGWHIPIGSSGEGRFSNFPLAIWLPDEPNNIEGSEDRGYFALRGNATRVIDVPSSSPRPNVVCEFVPPLGHADACGWETAEPARLYLHDLLAPVNWTAGAFGLTDEECRLECAALPACAAVTYIFSTPQPICFLHAAAALPSLTICPVTDPSINGSRVHIKRCEGLNTCFAKHPDHELGPGSVLATLRPCNASGTPHTVERCLVECRATPRCLAVRHDKITGNCQLMDTSVTAAQASFDAYVLRVGTAGCEERRESPTGSCPYAYTPLAQLDVESQLFGGSELGGAASLEACFDACDARDTCQAFAYSDILGYCAIYEGHSGPGRVYDPHGDLYVRQTTNCSIASPGPCAWEMLPNATGTLLSLGGKQNRIHCAALCRDSPDSGFFTHIHADSVCGLYKAGADVSVGEAFSRVASSCPAPEPPSPAEVITNGVCLTTFPHLILDGVCYHIFLKHNVSSVSSAEKKCENDLAALAAVPDLATLTDVLAVFGDFGEVYHVNLRQRLGLSTADEAAGMDWYMTGVDGNKMPAWQPFGWATNEPNNIAGEDWGALSVADQGFWDKPVSSPQAKPLCQQPINVPCFEPRPGEVLGGEALNGAGATVDDFDACAALCLAEPRCAAFEIPLTQHLQPTSRSTQCVLRGLGDGTTTAANGTDTWERLDTCWPLTNESCPHRRGSVLHGDSCYGMSGALLQHGQAKDLCLAGGGYLAVLDSQEAWTALVATGDLRGWIGLEQEFSPDVYSGWMWQHPDGVFELSPLPDLWRQGQPDDIEGVENGHENFAYVHDAGGLNDVDAGHYQRALCAFPPKTTTTSSSTTSSSSSTTTSSFSTMTTTSSSTSSTSSSTTTRSTSTTAEATTRDCAADATTTPDRAKCWAQCDPVLVDGWCFARYYQTRLWADGKTFCKNKGGQLAAFHTDQALNTFRGQHVDNVPHGNGFIALRKDAGLGHDQWKTVWPDDSEELTALTNASWNPSVTPKNTSLLLHAFLSTANGIHAVESHRQQSSICMFPPYETTTTGVDTTSTQPPSTTTSVPSTSTTEPTTSTRPATTTTDPCAPRLERRVGVNVPAALLGTLFDAATETACWEACLTNSSCALASFAPLRGPNWRCLLKAEPVDWALEVPVGLADLAGLVSLIKHWPCRSEAALTTTPSPPPSCSYAEHSNASAKSGYTLRLEHLDRAQCLELCDRDAACGGISEDGKGSCLLVSEVHLKALPNACCDILEKRFCGTTTLTSSTSTTTTSSTTSTTTSTTSTTTSTTTTISTTSLAVATAESSSQSATTSDPCALRHSRRPGLVLPGRRISGHSNVSESACWEICAADADCLLATFDPSFGGTSNWRCITKGAPAQWGMPFERTGAVTLVKECATVPAGSPGTSAQRCRYAEQASSVSNVGAFQLEHLSREQCSELCDALDGCVAFQSNHVDLVCRVLGPSYEASSVANGCCSVYEKEGCWSSTSLQQSSTDGVTSGAVLSTSSTPAHSTSEALSATTSNSSPTFLTTTSSVAATSISPHTSTSTGLRSSSEISSSGLDILTSTTSTVTPVPSAVTTTASIAPSTTTERSSSELATAPLSAAISSTVPSTSAPTAHTSKKQAKASSVAMSTSKEPAVTSAKHSTMTTFDVQNTETETMVSARRSAVESTTSAAGVSSSHGPATSTLASIGTTSTEMTTSAAGKPGSSTPGSATRPTSEVPSTAQRTTESVKQTSSAISTPHPTKVTSGNDILTTKTETSKETTTNRSNFDQTTTNTHMTKADGKTSTTSRPKFAEYSTALEEKADSESSPQVTTSPKQVLPAEPTSRKATTGSPLLSTAQATLGATPSWSAANEMTELKPASGPVSSTEILVDELHPATHTFDAVMSIEPSPPTSSLMERTAKLGRATSTTDPGKRPPGNEEATKEVDKSIEHSESTVENGKSTERVPVPEVTTIPDNGTTQIQSSTVPDLAKQSSSPRPATKDIAPSASRAPVRPTPPTLELEPALTPLEQEKKAEEDLGQVVAEVLGDALLSSLGGSFAGIPGLDQQSADSDAADLGVLGLGDGGVMGQAVVDDFGDFPVPGEAGRATTEPPPPPRPDQSAIVATLKDALPLLVGSLDEAELAAVGVSKEETFANCHYDRVPCDLREMKSFVDKRYGNCFVFNWNGTRMVDRSSKDHGFFVQLNVQRDEYMALTESVGMRVALGEPGVVPVPYANGFNVAAGFSNLFELEYSEVHLAGAPYSDCAVSANRSSFLLEGRYSLDGCLESCVQAAVVEQCNCLDPTKPDLPSAHHLKRCDLVRKKCLDVFLGSEAALKNAHCARCRDPCSQGLYQRTQTQVLWPHQKELVSGCTGEYAEGLESSAYQRCRQDAEASTVTMWMKMNKISHRKYREIPKLDGSKVLSTVGGNLGIALGVSALSLVELLLLLCRYLGALAQ